jgi:hypothetical protein
MSDTTKVYVYTGSETGYTYGDWYYYDGEDWVSGGEYASTALYTDQTPTQGSTNAVSSGGVYSALERIDILFRKFLQALRYSAYADENINLLYQEIDEIINPPVDVASITAVYDNTQQIVYNTDSIDYLKQALTVTATYSDETTGIITDYTLTGEMSGGLQTFTVTYRGKTTTFNAIIYEFVFTKGLLSGRTDGKASIKQNNTRILANSTVGTVPMNNEDGTPSAVFCIPLRPEYARLYVSDELAEYRKAYIVLEWDDTINDYVQVISTGWVTAQFAYIDPAHRNADHYMVINVSGTTGTEDMTNVDTSDWSAYFGNA